MARKSIKGYSEKNYYDNIRFNGVRATTDYLNEGYFKHLVNFDIADTGASLKPREGYLTTKFNDLSFAYSDQVVYFKLLRTGEYIFIDLHDFRQGTGAYHGWVRKGALDIESEYIVEPDSVNLNQSDSFIALPKDDTFTTTEALPILNKNGTQYHVFKYSGRYIQMLYSYEGGSMEGANIAPNTLYIDVVDTEDIMSIDSNYRNIASFQSIIPSKFTNILPHDTTDHVIQQFPLIYVQDNDSGKYFINTINTDDITIKPYFTVKDYPEDAIYEWAYTYDIYSTKFEFADTQIFTNEHAIVYRAPIYSLHHSNISPLLNYYRSWADIINDVHSDANYIYNTIEQVLSLNASINDNCSKLIDSVESSNIYIINIVPTFAMVDDPTVDANIPDSVKSGGDWTDDAFIEMIQNIISHYDWGDSSTYFTNLYNKLANTYSSLDEFYSTVADYDLRFYVDSFSSYTISNTYFNEPYNSSDRLLFEDLRSPLFTRTTKPLTLAELQDYLKARTVDSLCVRVHFNAVGFTYSKNTYSDFSTLPSYISRWFPGIHNHDTSKDSFTFYIYGNGTFYTDDISTDCIYPSIEGYIPVLTNNNLTEPIFYNFNSTSNDVTIFAYNANHDLVCNLAPFPNNLVIDRLTNDGYFNNGVAIAFYLFPVLKQQHFEGTTWGQSYDRQKLISSTSLLSSRSISLSSAKPTYIVETITKEPTDIRDAIEYVVFNDSRLVTWIGNTVYMSEEGDFNYFTYANVFTFDERVVKVIQYKDTLLVFTKLHLYSIFPYENTVPVQDGVDDEGNPKFVQQTQIVYNKLPVLYNLRVDDRYKDAIQVFNQMVLFYSSEGQMYMIKPTATIDSNTRFSIQYFNQDVNDILLNYDAYMTERVQLYGTNKVITKDMVNIKVHVSINYITIYYTVPSIYTYILIYDIVNNRYFVYDTMSFSDIRGFITVPYGDFIITSFDDKLYFTTKYTELYVPDSNVDKTVYYNFKPDDIHLELDTGVINLNNHLKKRFRQLYLIYKNLDSRNIEFTLETFVDDVPQLTYMSPTFELKNINEKLTREVVYSNNVVKLATEPIQLSPINILADNTALFDFSAYTSNNIITHNINIPSLGRALRMRFTFKSKGKFKFQGYGLIYKEHQV